MRFAYEDLLSGCPIFVEKVGHFRSPLLENLKPSGIGIQLYNSFLHLMVLDKEDFLKYLPISQTKLIQKNEKLNLFDVMIQLKSDYREFFRQALEFFMLEEVLWDEKSKCFLTFSKKDKKRKEIGEINRNNFEEVRDMIAQMNYINPEKPDELKFKTEKAKRLWEITQKKLKELNKNADNKNMRLGNIISKICAVGIGYNILNIYDLTVFQLYDQFMQYGFLRGSALTENAAAHGCAGDNFRFEDWLKPITQI